MGEGCADEREWVREAVPRHSFILLTQDHRPTTNKTKLNHGTLGSLVYFKETWHYHDIL